MFKNNKILIIGDLMLDTYLYGTVDRVSPEAPVPVIDVQSMDNKLGGAGNVALNVKQLDSEPIICSVIGNDDSGKKLKEIMNENGIMTDYIISSDSRKTTNKTRLIGNKYQIARFDDEMVDELNYNDYTNLTRTIELVIEKHDIDVILIQDYDKGVIDRNLIDKIVELSVDIPVIVDPKKRNFSFYKNIKLIKPNYKELKEGLNIESVERDEVLKLGVKKLHKRGIEIVFVTLSDDGIFISYDNGRKSKIVPGTKRHIYDVSGAGDTVISIISTLINKDLTIDEIDKISNVAGGIVCEHAGVMPIDIEKLKNEI